MSSLRQEKNKCEKAKDTENQRRGNKMWKKDADGRVGIVSKYPSLFLTPHNTSNPCLLFSYMIYLFFYVRGIGFLFVSINSWFLLFYMLVCLLAATIFCLSACISISLHSLVFFAFNSFVSKQSNSFSFRLFPSVPFPNSFNFLTLQILLTFLCSSPSFF